MTSYNYDWLHAFKQEVWCLVCLLRFMILQSPCKID